MTHFPDVLRGIALLLFIVLLAGAIAYVGDRVGHQVGRKRLTLFGIRPRYTSTIIAVGTGMMIALIVTLGAILLSQEVKTAFFRLNAINAQIASLQTRQKALESSHVVINVNTVMSPVFFVLTQAQSPDERIKLVRQLYLGTVANIKTLYAGAPLKPFVEPKDLDQRIREVATGPRIEAMLAHSNVIVLAATDTNIYPHDAIHFSLQAIPDVVVFRRQQPIFQLKIPASKNVVPALAVQELEDHVASVAERAGMPVYFLGNVQVAQYYPAPAEMQRELTSASGHYVMTAFAAADVYPHTVGIPIVVTVQKASP